MRLNEILNLFDVDRKISETSYQVKCPVHGDQKASLTISEKDGRILMYCHAGCETEDILQEVGLTTRDLIVKSSAEEDFKNLPKWQRGLEAMYDYFDDAGNYAYSKLRYEGKKIFYGFVEDGQCDYKGVTKDRYLYNSRELKKAIDEQTPVYIVEGEKDVETMKRLKLIATTAGGTSDWRKRYASVFKGAWVTILPDNDEPGQKLADQIVKDIKDLCYCYRVVTVSNQEKGDVTDYIMAGHSREDLLKLIDSEPWITKGKKEPPPLEMYDAAELLKMELKPPRMLIENLLPEGVCILSAPSKMGKSWFAMDLGLSLINSLPVLGFSTNKCGVVYFALEDSWSRLQRRLRKLTGSSEIPDGLTLVTKCEPIHEGFLQQVETAIKGKPDIGLIIVDTLQKVKPPSSRDKSPYEQDYQTFSEVSKLAHKYNVCVLFLHHTRKSNGFDGDPFEDILGSTALQGATDAMYVIKKKKRTDEEAFFFATGRDIDQHELMIKFDKETCKWQNLGDAGSIEQLRAELEYRNHPAIITLKYKLDSIEADPDESIKEYITTMKDFRNDTIEHTGQVIGTSAQSFKSIVTNLDPYLLKDKIRHVEPERNTTFKGKNGRFHRYKRTPIKG